MMAVMMIVMVPRAAASAERIRDGARRRPRRSLDPERPAAEPCREARAGSSSATSSSATPGAEDRCCRTISFTLGPGETTAIVGGTGSGKTHAGQPAARGCSTSRPAPSCVDGVDVRDLARDELWARIGHRPAAGLPVQRERSRATCASVGPTPPTTSSGTRSRSRRRAEFVELLPEGLEAPVDQGGANVSGGQRQRLAIARCAGARPAGLPLRRQLLRPRLRDRRPAAGGAAPADPRGRRARSWRSGSARSCTPTGSWCWTAAASSASGTHDELHERLRDLPGDRPVAARRGGGGMSRARPPRAPTRVDPVGGGGGPMGGPAWPGDGRAGEAQGLPRHAAPAGSIGCAPSGSWSSSSLVLAVVSVRPRRARARSCWATRPTIIFEGVVGKQLPAGAHAGSRRWTPCAPPARPGWPTWSRR